MPDTSSSDLSSDYIRPIDPAFPETALEPPAVGDVPGPLAAVEVGASRRLGIPGFLAIAWLVTIVGLALLAPYLPLRDPNEANEDLRYLLPGSEQAILGGDALGRDVFSRLVWGARISLLVGVASILIGLLIGGFLGMVAGFYRNRVARALVVLFDILLAIPSLILALALVAVFAGGANVSDERRVTVQIIALGIVSIPLLARITRGSTLSWSEREFVTASRALGAKPNRILMREVLPNVLPAMFSITLLGIGIAIVAEGGLALLGAGVAERPTWGNMISQVATSDLERSYHVIFSASACIFLTVLSLNFLGDVIRARSDVRESLL